jgi:cytosine/adenosine deaminase-related metal-dependent hydrolase
MTAREMLEIATREGARVLGRDDIGHLAPGMAADMALFDQRSLAYAGGAVHDPVAALLLCAPAQAAWTLVNGRPVVQEGRLTPVDLGPLIERHNRLARQLVAA